MNDWHSMSRTKGRPLVMGILNITPDSFSDGGAYFSIEAAVARAVEMEEQGADIIDIGGESTRPGATPVPLGEELRRTVETVRAIRSAVNLPISVDTYKAEVARACIAAGADIVNDVLGLRGEGMLKTVADTGTDAVVCFMHGTPRTFSTDLLQGDAGTEVRRFLMERVATAEAAGIPRNRLILDPGIGFGLDNAQSIEVLENCGRICQGFPILVGPSRKRFLSDMFPGTNRDEASASASKIAYMNGADIVRVHDVKGTIEAFK